MSEWKTIETAPMPGIDVILWCPKWAIPDRGSYDANYGWYTALIGFSDTPEYEPTHWMPLPPPPEPAKVEVEEK